MQVLVPDVPLLVEELPDPELALEPLLGGQAVQVVGRAGTGALHRPPIQADGAATGFDDALIGLRSLCGRLMARHFTNRVLATAVAIGATLLIAAPAWGAPRYASPAGGGDCSQASPCDLEIAVEGAADGDEVVIAPGDLRIAWRTRLFPRSSRPARSTSTEPRADRGRGSSAPPTARSSSGPARHYMTS